MLITVTCYFDYCHFNSQTGTPSLYNKKLLIMQTNVVNKDKSVRIAISIAIGALGLFYQSWWGLLAFIPLITGLISFCPIYKFLGVNTCNKKSVL
jgi:Protein of unknown function (DUF2892)